jgi:hypothetical protein
MNTSIKIRAMALVAAVLVTFGVIDLIADCAYPVPAALSVASVLDRRNARCDLWAI